MKVSPLKDFADLKLNLVTGESRLFLLATRSNENPLCFCFRNLLKQHFCVLKVLEARGSRESVNRLWASLTDSTRFALIRIQVEWGTQRSNAGMLRGWFMQETHTLSLSTHTRQGHIRAWTPY